MKGAVLLGLISLICIGDIAIALFLSATAKSTNNIGVGPKVGSVDPDNARRVSRMLLITAPLAWLFFAALCFGLFGPIHVITPISF